MTQISWVAGDTAGPIVARLTTDDGPQNLTAATVVAQVRNVASGTVTPVPCTVTDELAGVVEVPAGERVQVPGTYAMRFVVTYAGGTIDVFPSAGGEPLATVLPSWES